jgi:hypothetical protein
LARDIVRYRELNEDVTTIAIKIEQYRRDLDAVQARLSSCESRLMLARASERVATLQKIPRKMGAVCSGWTKGSCTACGIHVRTTPLEDE